MPKCEVRPALRYSKTSPVLYLATDTVLQVTFATESFEASLDGYCFPKPGLVVEQRRFFSSNCLCKTTTRGPLVLLMGGLKLERCTADGTQNVPALNVGGSVCDRSIIYICSCYYISMQNPFLFEPLISAMREVHPGFDGGIQTRR